MRAKRYVTASRALITQKFPLVEECRLCCSLNQKVLKYSRTFGRNCSSILRILLAKKSAETILVFGFVIFSVFGDCRDASAILFKYLKE